MAIVKFLPSGAEVEVAPGETLFRAAQAAGIPIGSVCGGIGSCTGCRVRILEGEEHLSAMGYKERERLGNTYFITKERLACQTTTDGPLVVEVLQEQQRDKRDRARRRALDRTLENAQRRAQRNSERQSSGNGGGDGSGTARGTNGKQDRDQRHGPSSGRTRRPPSERRSSSRHEHRHAAAATHGEQGAGGLPADGAAASVEQGLGTHTHRTPDGQPSQPDEPTQQVAVGDGAGAAQGERSGSSRRRRRRRGGRRH